MIFKKELSMRQEEASQMMREPVCNKWKIKLMKLKSDVNIFCYILRCNLILHSEWPHFM